ncbi:hypothetical protein PISMIDRAFT_686722 [Pisolithus microcarpus 441]|uniref:Uncharacterized protein n=1 Tax=Pisolithus microcarpus 441 TaxID=765257 RepID=A0A0C9Z1C4_9AGAM|nr:hypothetical protein BKA83DRAFT_686722 [Pisolithus microcarpus]KIK16047.1 hypothetical protein PISMIDRAFT_686722 [Pisolithus microcarpus 441]
MGMDDTRSRLCWASWEWGWWEHGPEDRQRARDISRIRQDRGIVRSWRYRPIMPWAWSSSDDREDEVSHVTSVGDLLAGIYTLFQAQVIGGPLIYNPTCPRPPTTSRRLPMATSFAPCSASLNASTHPPSHTDRSGNSSSCKNYVPIPSGFSIRIFKAPLLSPPSHQRASWHHHNPTNLLR